MVPEAEPRVIHMVDTLGAELQSAQVHDVTVLAAEGTLAKNLYGEILLRLVDFLSGFPSSNVILGCTEFPVIVRQLRQHPELSKEIRRYCFWDPLESILNSLESNNNI